MVGLSIATLLHAGSDVRGDECVYVANSGSDYVSVIDSATRTNVASFAVEGTPVALVPVPEKRILYVLTRAGYGEPTKVVSLSLDTGAILRCIRGLPVYAYALLVSPDGSTVYVAEDRRNTITAVDLSSGQVLQNFAIGGDQHTGLSVPTHLALSADGSRIYAPLPDAGSVGAISVIDLASGSLTKVSFLPGLDTPEPFSVLLSADGTVAYVLSSFGQTIAVLDTATNALVEALPVRVEAPTAFALSPDGRVLYTVGSNVVTSVNVETSEETWQALDAYYGHASLAVSASDVFVAQEVAATVFVVNPTNTAIEAEIPVGRLPRDIAVANIPGPCMPEDYIPLPTQTPSSTRTFTPTGTPTPTIDYACKEGMACLVVTSLSGRAGDSVSMEARLRTAGYQITVIRNDLGFDPVASFGRCKANSSLGVARFFTESFSLYAGVWGPNLQALADDTVLYTCTVKILRDAPPGSYRFYVSNIEATDPSGNSVPIGGTTDGRLDILAPGESTSGCQVIHPPPGSFVSPLLLLAGALCGVMRIRRAGRPRSMGCVDGESRGSAKR